MSKKNLTILIAFVLLTTSCQILSKKPTKEYFLVHIHGDWCKTCGSVDPVLHSLESYFKTKKGVEYVVFDETNPEALVKSRELASKLGLENIFEYERHTGELLFVDKNTKKVIANFCGVTERDEYINALENLLAGNTISSHDKEPKKYKLSKPPVEKIKKAKLYVIDIHHDKCGTCAITAPIFEKVAEQYISNNNVSFFTFDLSTPKTIDQTRKLAIKLGLREIYDSHKHTGEVLFVDPQTKNVKNNLVAEKNIVRYHEIIDKLLGSKA